MCTPLHCALPCNVHSLAMCAPLHLQSGALLYVFAVAGAALPPVLLLCAHALVGRLLKNLRGLLHKVVQHRTSGKQHCDHNVSTILEELTDYRCHLLDLLEKSHDPLCSHFWAIFVLSPKLGDCPNVAQTRPVFAMLTEDSAKAFTLLPFICSAAAACCATHEAC